MKKNVSFFYNTTIPWPEKPEIFENSHARVQAFITFFDTLRDHTEPLQKSFTTLLEELDAIDDWTRSNKQDDVFDQVVMYVIKGLTHCLFQHPHHPDIIGQLHSSLIHLTTVIYRNPKNNFSKTPQYPQFLIDHYIDILNSNPEDPLYLEEVVGGLSLITDPFIYFVSNRQLEKVVTCLIPYLSKDLPVLEEDLSTMFYNFLTWRESVILSTLRNKEIRSSLINDVIDIEKSPENKRYSIKAFFTDATSTLFSHEILTNQDVHLLYLLMEEAPGHPQERETYFKVFGESYAHFTQNILPQTKSKFDDTLLSFFLAASQTGNQDAKKESLHILSWLIKTQTVDFNDRLKNQKTLRQLIDALSLSVIEEESETHQQSLEMLSWLIKTYHIDMEVSPRLPQFMEKMCLTLTKLNTEAKQDAVYILTSWINDCHMPFIQVAEQYDFVFQGIDRLIKSPDPSDRLLGIQVLNEILCRYSGSPMPAIPDVFENDETEKETQGNATDKALEEMQKLEDAISEWVLKPDLPDSEKEKLAELWENLVHHPYLDIELLVERHPQLHPIALLDLILETKDFQLAKILCNTLIIPSTNIPKLFESNPENLFLKFLTLFEIAETEESTGIAIDLVFNSAAALPNDLLERAVDPNQALLLKIRKRLSKKYPSLNVLNISLMAFICSKTNNLKSFGGKKLTRIPLLLEHILQGFNNHLTDQRYAFVIYTSVATLELLNRLINTRTEIPLDTLSDPDAPYSKSLNAIWTFSKKLHCIGNQNFKIYFISHLHALLKLMVENPTFGMTIKIAEIIRSIYLNFRFSLPTVLLESTLVEILPNLVTVFCQTMRHEKRILQRVQIKHMSPIDECLRGNPVSFHILDTLLQLSRSHPIAVKTAFSKLPGDMIDHFFKMILEIFSDCSPDFRKLIVKLFHTTFFAWPSRFIQTLANSKHFISELESLNEQLGAYNVARKLNKQLKNFLQRKRSDFERRLGESSEKKDTQIHRVKVTKEVYSQGPQGIFELLLKQPQFEALRNYKERLLSDAVTQRHREQLRNSFDSLFTQGKDVNVPNSAVVLTLLETCTIQDNEGKTLSGEALLAHISQQFPGKENYFKKALVFTHALPNFTKKTYAKTLFTLSKNLTTWMITIHKAMAKLQETASKQHTHPNEHTVA